MEPEPKLCNFFGSGPAPAKKAGSGWLRLRNIGFSKKTDIIINNLFLSI